MDPAQAVAAAARDSYAQLLAFVAARAGGDVASAEDALAEAFLAALRQWPRDGVPDKPEAWLLTTARRRLMDDQRRSRTRTHTLDALTQAMQAAQIVIDAGDDFPDERLKLLFVCAHPAINPAARTPLMLQTVLGLEADRIAPAFLTSPAAMSQRLVRAKTKIRDAGVPFEIPPREEWPQRLSFVLDAVYAAFTASWEGSESGPADLASEAVWLARVLVHLMPDEPEALGLLALVLYCQSRRAARLVNGSYIPLPEQDTARWDAVLIEQAEAILRVAARRQRLGRFQLEAAIQSIHAQRLRTGEIDWPAIAMMYDALVQHTTALGAQIGRAIAHGRVRGPAAGLALLDMLPGEALQNHQPYWAARAPFLAELDRSPEAKAAYSHAIALSTDRSITTFLTRRSASLAEPTPTRRSSA